VGAAEVESLLGVARTGGWGEKVTVVLLVIGHMIYKNTPYI